jgi:hypothetical protein
LANRDCIAAREAFGSRPISRLPGMLAISAFAQKQWLFENIL